MQERAQRNSLNINGFIRVIERGVTNDVFGEIDVTYLIGSS